MDQGRIIKNTGMWVAVFSLIQLEAFFWLRICLCACSCLYFACPWGQCPFTLSSCRLLKKKKAFLDLIYNCVCCCASLFPPFYLHTNKIWNVKKLYTQNGFAVASYVVTCDKFMTWAWMDTMFLCSLFRLCIFSKPSPSLTLTFCLSLASTTVNLSSHFVSLLHCMQCLILSCYYQHISIAGLYK